MREKMRLERTLGERRLEEFVCVCERRNLRGFLENKISDSAIKENESPPAGACSCRRSKFKYHVALRVGGYPSSENGR